MVPNYGDKIVNGLKWKEVNNKFKTKLRKYNYKPIFKEYNH